MMLVLSNVNEVFILKLIKENGLNAVFKPFFKWQGQSTATHIHNMS